MIAESDIERLMLKAVREVLHEMMQLGRVFAAELEQLTNGILQTLPYDGWRAELDTFFDAWVERGIRALPESIVMLKGWIAEQEIRWFERFSDPGSTLRSERRVELAYGLPADFISQETASALAQLGRIIMATYPAKD